MNFDQSQEMECVELGGRDGDDLPVQTLRFGDLSLLVESYRVLQNIRQACRFILPWTGHVLPLFRQAREYYTTEGGFKGSRTRSCRYVDHLIDGLYRLNERARRAMQSLRSSHFLALACHVSALAGGTQNRP